jgi:hypothetical protein
MAKDTDDVKDEQTGGEEAEQEQIRGVADEGGDEDETFEDTDDLDDDDAEDADDDTVV